MFEVILLLITYLFVFPAHAQAYLDPGTGSYITQILIGFLVGGLYMGKVYWQQLKTFISTFLNRGKQDGKKEQD